MKMEKILIKNGKIVLSDKTINGDILLNNGKIEKIDNEIVDDDAKVIDAKGNYVTPGLIDIHTHGGNGHDYMEGTYEAFSKATDLHFSHGTTAIVPTTVATTLESTLKFLNDYKKIKDNKDIKPRLLGVHLEGPYLSINQKGAIMAKYIKNPIKDEYMQILNSSNDIIRWTIAPELPGAMELGDELKKRGIGASMGHSDAIDTDIYNAINHGFTSVTHLYSMSSGVVRRNCYRYAGINETAYLCDELYTEAIADGHHLPNTLLKLIYKNKGTDKMILITDSMSAAGLGEGLFYLGNPKDNQQVLVKGGIAFMPDMSSFAGSVATSDQLVRTMLNIGLPIENVIKMASLTPAKLLGMDNEIGSLEVGKAADVVIFDKNIHALTVICQGKIKYES